MGTTQDCAELKLLLNFHRSVKPTGLRRTYPNDITREAVSGNEIPLDFLKKSTRATLIYDGILSNTSIDRRD